MSSESFFAELKFEPPLNLRELTLSDAEAVTDLVRKVDVAACGESTTTVEELAGDIESSIRGGGKSYGLFDAGKLQACIIVQNELRDGRGCFFDVFADPEIPVALMQPQIQKLVQATEKYASNFRTINSLAADYIKTALYEQDTAFISALKAENFELHRTYWRLRIDHENVNNQYEPPAKIEIVDFDKSGMSMRDMHELSSAIFQDHYDFSPMNFADWEIERNSGVNSSTLWRIAIINDNPVGYCWRSRRFESEGFSYVSSIGVLREFRGQGIAKALLMDSFHEATAANLNGTLLHCDASNPNGATALYENVGMRVDRVYPAYRKHI